jgi:hypothetical protein
LSQAGLAIKRKFILKQEDSRFQIEVQEIDFYRGELVEVMDIRTMNMGTGALPTNS